ncbi:MAG TPA: hypothetical protein DCQ47_04565 [Gammaproteobacteria bacterium]|nr:hypothetical protein [Gammaproteobacteria bacterium]
MPIMTNMKDRSFNLITLAVLMISLLGCGSNTITEQAVGDYKKAYSKISIGDARRHVLAILETSQQVIPLRFKKQPERYLSYGEQVEIHFVRTGLASGISNHDDDFTPFVFKNDILVSIGWTYVSKTEFLSKSREAISAGGVKQDQDIVGDRR